MPPDSLPTMGLRANGLLPVILTACLVRFAYVLAYPQVAVPCPDCGLYDRVAVNIAEGRGLVGGASAERGAARPDAAADEPEVGIGPVYAAFLAGIYRLAGHHFAPVRLVQAAFGVAVVPLMWRIGTAAFGPAAGRLCAWLVALSPPLIVYSGMLLTENLTVTLLVGSVWCLIAASMSRSIASFAGAGGLVGVLVLLREEMLLLVPAFAALAAWRADRRRARRQVLAFVLAALACIAVWTARNYVKFGKPILVSAHGGETLWISVKGWKEWRFDDPGLRQLVDGRTFVERDEVLRRDALRQIAAAPGRYFVLCIKRIPELWVSSHTSYVRGLSERYAVYAERGAYGRVAVKVGLLLLNLALLALAAVGLGRAFLAPRSMSLAAWATALPILVVSIVHFFLFSTARYQIPALPFVLAFAAATLAHRFGRAPAAMPASSLSGAA